MKYDYDKYLSQLEGAAETKGQSIPSDLNVVRADLVLFGAIKGLCDAVTRLDKTSSRLFVVNICLSVVMILLMAVQLWRALNP
jgi:hypothetical protein